MALTKDQKSEIIGSYRSHPADTGTPEEDTGPPDSSLPEQSACSCETPGKPGTSLPVLGAAALLGLGAIVMRRRRKSPTA